MKNKVYYGEYTLEQWINLILKKNITLPPYQRRFVWDEERSRNLINSIKNDLFIPPVTIGKYFVPPIKSGKDNVSSTNDGFINSFSPAENLILDGQQRLTSILLSKIGIFPDVDKIRRESREQEIETDEEIDDIPIDWTFTSLIAGKNSIDEIKKQALATGYYKEFDLDLNASFFKDNYIAFSYMVPDVKIFKAQQNYYSSVFRDINVQGIALSAMESRKALYFLKDELRDFFGPSFAKEYRLLSEGGTIDFVRYLAFLSEYTANGEYLDGIGRLYSNKFESYFVLYIQNMIGENDKSRFKSLPRKWDPNEYKPYVVKIENFLKQAKSDRSFDSIIEADLFMFGLVYYVLFLNASPKNNPWITPDAIGLELLSKSQEIKNEESRHTRNPNALRYLRSRISASIRIYSGYFDVN